MDQLLNALDRRTMRWVITTLIVGIPTIISTAWLASAWQQVAWGVPFAKGFVSIFGFAFLGGGIVGFGAWYLMERWIIRDRAETSWRWVLLRIVLYLLASPLLAMGSRVTLRVGVRVYPAIIETSYYVLSAVMLLSFGVTYTFLERAVKEVRERERKLYTQIRDLHIEIDELKKAQQLDEIVESDFFQELKAKGKQMRCPAASADTG